MKTNKVLAVALSTGLVLGGASVANAAAGDKYESREADGEEDEWYYVLKFDQEKAITKGNNPKTGLAGPAPIYSTLAISMASIVAAIKKND